MKCMLLFALCVSMALASGWEAVQRLTPAARIEVVQRDGSRVRSSFVSATPGSIVVRDGTGERAIAQTDVTSVRVADPSRRVRQGLIWTAIGVGAGVGIGFAVCPSCSNEGHRSKFVGPGAAIGAGLGALGFLSSNYRTVYHSTK